VRARRGLARAGDWDTLGTNLLRYFDKYARDDSVVKSVFDHVRNIGLAALVLAASAWKLKHAAPFPGGLFDYLGSTLLGLIGIGLLWMNHENLFHKLRKEPLSIWVHAFLAFLYAFAILEFIRFVYGGRVGA
jgi:hypothetical protein